MKTLCAAFVSVVVLLTVTQPVTARRMSDYRGHSNWWGGGMCRMMDVSPQPVDPASLPEPNSLGAKLLKDQCTQCHGLVTPGQHASQDWPAIVNRMERRMKMMAHGRRGMMRQSIEQLTPAEKQALLSYLQQHSFKAANLETMAQELTAAATTYIDVCSRCHALPDPSAHAPQAWEAVVERMNINMENLGMAPLTPMQKKEIMAYLQEHAKK